MLLTAMFQITMDTIIPTFFDMDSLFLISVILKILERGARNENLPLPTRFMSMIHEWEGKSPDQTPYPFFFVLLVPLLRREGSKNFPNPCYFILVRFKSDENNILQPAIHLFSNQPIYYLLFD